MKLKPFALIAFTTVLAVLYCGQAFSQAVPVSLQPGATQGMVVVQLGGSSNFNPALLGFSALLPSGMSLGAASCTTITPQPQVSCLQTGNRVTCAVLRETLERIPTGQAMVVTFTAASPLACRPLLRMIGAVGVGPGEDAVSTMQVSTDPVRIPWPLAGDMNGDGVVDSADLAAALQRALAAEPVQAQEALLGVLRVLRGRAYPQPDCVIPSLP